MEEGVEGLIHISDLSWTKKIKHPSEFTKVEAPIDVVVLDIDKENRRLSLGHKQLEENPWETYETIFTRGSVHEGTISELTERGGQIRLDPYGVEGFATPKHLTKEDGTTAKQGETLMFKVIDFNKDSKHIILSHSRIFEDYPGRRYRPGCPQGSTGEERRQGRGSQDRGVINPDRNQLCAGTPVRGCRHCFLCACNRSSIAVYRPFCGLFVPFA